ncbi:FtsQ-type POTRA domain-containing protein [Paenibacillus sp. Marseille-Q4541]|uniref:cell division protein FtsQ/DivIB n=1 Tax=Paenibacillus sp. Marseille-Q4541 TaxID=2831522 RepID=UPI001BA4F23B|nr:FtsQ-type POTRA domain-containing protein [Paenibacillus sp. Marseille-Q4541]
MPNNQMPALKKESMPKRKTNRKLITVLILLFIAILAAVFFRSPVSKISQIQIDGNVFTTKEEILAKSGLAVGNPFFGDNGTEVEKKLKENPAVSAATVDKQFPGTIVIHIKEYDAVAYELASDGQLHAILSSGVSVTLPESGMAVEKPILTHWKDDDPVKVELSKVLKEIPNELTTDISEIIPSPTPSFPDRIKLYTKSQFEVITSVSLLKDKVSYLNQVIETEEPGIITMLEADSYEPFNPAPPEEESAETGE